jgi:predicted ArsR family transcriptional regulator
MSDPSGWTLETQREHLLALIEHEREVREARADALAKALGIQAIETLRRLDELNHAHDTAMENWRQSLPRELFEQFREDHAKWKETVNTAMALGAQVHANTSRVESRIVTIETIANKLTGALILLGAMGVAGVIAFFLGVARLAGVLK